MDGTSPDSGLWEVYGASGNSTSHWRDQSPVKFLLCQHCTGTLGSLAHFLRFCFLGITRWGFQDVDAEMEFGLQSIY